jgi:hypothetical protein
MKISNWLSKVASALVAAGCICPAAMAAVNIPLGDPSFENYAIPTGGPANSQFAYANQYRPTSAWVSRIDDMDYVLHQYHQDSGPLNSNWLYTSAYAELLTSNPGGTGNNPGGVIQGRRPAPRSGNQALHGRAFHFSGQIVPTPTAVFEAGKQYTFSVYAQGDSNAEFDSAGWRSRVNLFIYDASIRFRNLYGFPNDSNPYAFTALTYDPTLYDVNSENFTYFPPDRFAPDEPIPPELTETHPGQFVNRSTTATATQSRAAWQKISISWQVVPGAPEVGHPIGVAFRVGDDAAVDDAAFIATGGIGDLNFDDSFTAADWNILRSSQLADLSSLSLKQRYLAGDLNADGFNDHADFLLFKNAYDQANGPGSFVAMISAVPEPTTTFLLSTAGIFLTLVRKRRS